ncbi:uncharacterized protein LOC129607737 [Condylostylus longicornis]|uniref:uncharacterized protein LOC129607737 n=1 Tax=Condylostylus longicornis TaxID=2530218 RepID=UPI00244DBA18|nr:uncharacterized protein LOC129607737 [Condylostylus longicornis]
MVKYKNHYEAIPVLKHWLKTQPHLPIIEDSPLRSFIVFCDGDVEEAKILIDKHYTFRTNNPQIFGNRDVNSKAFEKLNEILDLILLPDLTPDNHLVTIFRIRSPDVTYYNYTEQVRFIIAVLDAHLRVFPMDKTPDGVYLILDLKEFTLQHLTRVDFSAARVLTKYMEDVISIKIPRSNIINCPTFISRIVTMARTFITEKTYKKFVIHETNNDELFDYIPRDILPIEINGTKGSIDDIKRENLKVFKENADYIFNSKYWFVDESKRPANSRKSQFENMQGNFRSLSVD